MKVFILLVETWMRVFDHPERATQAQHYFAT